MRRNDFPRQRAGLCMHLTAVWATRPYPESVWKDVVSMDEGFMFNTTLLPSADVPGCSNPIYSGAYTWLVIKHPLLSEPGGSCPWLSFFGVARFC